MAHIEICNLNDDRMYESVNLVKTISALREYLSEKIRARTPPISMLLLRINIKMPWPIRISRLKEISANKNVSLLNHSKMFVILFKP